ncbi:SHOCT domain-containing protein [Dactylosporangium sucinum]|uniref:SHOCT domain-containing protein n=1 Tax=Dactylosporangium sucinum TaxID=1424081 RepID=A0A917UBP5_9ACTN|nr:SHOCT domain-containing protein [Dactylosporangium sucinum]GGM76528.1 hypothetical protein GCM10007977_092500 [Dactylosporangium sucinum]
MGIFDFLTGGSQPPPGGVRGVAQVVSATRHNGRGIYQNCRMHLVLQAPGLAPYAAEFHGLVHHRRWPTPGATLPVSIDPHNPRAFAILWDEVPDPAVVARQQAERLAQAMRDRPAPGAGPPLSDVAPDPLSQLERLAALRAQGVLTEAEFEHQKRRILGT